MRWAALASSLAAGLVGCGTQGAPQPPSLNLPDPVGDLSATRAGDRVTLAWTMPKKNTDKLPLKGDLPVRVCRKEGAGACETAGGDLKLPPGAEGTFTETLPPLLASNAPRSLSYFVELKNRNGRSAGLSNAAVVPAGEAPAPVSGLAAEMRRDGVALSWTSGPDADRPSVRLHRKLIASNPVAKSRQSPLAPPPEPVERNLLVSSCAEDARKESCRALDKSIRFGESYEYRAQRVLRVPLDGKTLELAGEISAPVRIAALDLFPPTVPTDLVAVATLGESGPETATETAIDLSWQPVPDLDLAGYAVYRREGDRDWQRISPAQPLPAPAFRDPQVRQGHTYSYAVTSIGQTGHESARSAEAQETVPAP